jgi:hypothetical protein
MASSSWALTGNANTDPTADFLGTTDNKALVIKTGGAERLRVDSSGNLALGTTVAPGLLSLGGTYGIKQVINDGSGVANYNCGLGTDLTIGAGNSFDLFLAYGDPTTPSGDTSLNILAPAGPWPYTAYSALVTVRRSGSVGIGTSAPSSRLHVVGDVTVTGDVLLTGADCAEHFDVSGEKLPEPGTVVVIDGNGGLRESHEPYDKKVAGVVSGAGEYRHALVLDKRVDCENRVAVALLGKVYCKVDAQYAAIEIGDLLTTSRTPGCAMKAVEPLMAFGAIIGKALRPLESGTGLIPILIALQ